MGNTHYIVRRKKHGCNRTAAVSYTHLDVYKRQGVNYADLFSVFRAHANVLYYKTDSHWTNRGAALAHDYLMNTLSWA